MNYDLPVPYMVISFPRFQYYIPYASVILRSNINRVIRSLRRIWLGWVSCGLFPIENQSQPQEILFAVGKIGPNATFNLIFLGLGRPWVG